MTLKGRDYQEINAFVKIEGQIGHGSFGAVKSVLVKTHEHSIERLALKISAPGEEQLAYQEADVLLHLDHENTCMLRYFFEENNSIQVFLEMMEEGDLNHMIHNLWDPSLGLGVYLELFAYQIFRGLNYMHSIGIAHRDIKPANVLISRSTGMAKLTDFNCAANLTHKPEHSPNVGTKVYMAPELRFKCKAYDFGVDIWSAGIVLTDMILTRSIFLIDKPDKPKEILACIIEYLGRPTEQDFNDMQIAMEDRQKCANVEKVRDMRDVLGELPPGVSDRDKFYALLPQIFNLNFRNRSSAYEVCANSFFDHIRSGKPLLDNGYRLPEVFDIPYQ